MGCDIHMYVEYKKSVNDVTKWVSGDYFKQNPFYGVYNDEAQYERIELHGNRNYSLFSTLAGVRDYSDKVNPVSTPKGIPEDACEFVQQENERWDRDGHNHSWLTLKELKDYQAKNPVMHYSGLVSPQAAVALDTQGVTPNEWCQGTTLKDWAHREWSEQNNTLPPLIEKLEKRAKELLQYEWQEYDPANDEKVRIVFWFDN